MKKRSFLDGLIDTLASTAATELSERLPGVSTKGKATARRHLRRQLRDSMRDGVKGAANAAKKLKEKVTKSNESIEDSISSVQFRTACNVLGITDAQYGKPVDAEKLRDAKRAKVKQHHPDAGGSREQLQQVVAAAEWLERYNETLARKK